MSNIGSNENIAEPEDESKPVLEESKPTLGDGVQDAPVESSQNSVPEAPPPSLEETHPSADQTSGDAGASQLLEPPQGTLSEEPGATEVEEAQLNIEEAPKSGTPSASASEEPPVLEDITEEAPIIASPFETQLPDIERDVKSMLGFHDGPESDALNPEQMATEILFDIINETLKSHETPIDSNTLFAELSEHDELTAFIEDTLGALADDIAMGDREYIPHDEAYFWMTYFFLQFCGFRIFLANIDEAIIHGQNLKELAEIVVDLVDHVAESAAYLHADSDLPEHVAKNIIWQMLNSRMMLRRYDGRGVAYWQAEDILDEILEKVTARPVAVKLREMHPGFSIRKSTRVGKPESEIQEEPKECREFAGIFNVAEDFVATLLDTSTQIVKQGVGSSWAALGSPKDSRSSTKDAMQQVASVKSMGSVHSSFMKTSDIRHPLLYPRIGDFNTKEGKHTITTILHKWKMNDLSEDWGYSIKFLMGQSDACSDYYIYEAKFGLPTPLYPVPQATCSLLFTIEVSRVKPPVCPVSVSYKIEGSGLVLIPEEYIFQEDWLVNVVDSKLRLFSRLRF